MLKYRLTFGTAMIVALLGIVALDAWLDQIDISGTVWQKLFFGRTYLPAGLGLLLLAMTLCVLWARELSAIFRAKNIPTDPLIIAVAGMIGALLTYMIPHRLDSQVTIGIFATVVVLLFLISLVKHSWGGRVEGAIAAGAIAMFSMIYAGLLPGFFLAIRRWHSAWVVVAIILITKSCDTGAYFVGRLMGRHKLIVWLSPGKTWEGLFGGVIISGLVAMAVAALFNHLQLTLETVHLAGIWRIDEQGRRFDVITYPLVATAAAGALIGVVGQLGDLTASLLKRDAGIKESGWAVPGFGGVLDVVDSPFLVAPLAYWMLRLLAGTS